VRKREVESGAPATGGWHGPDARPTVDSLPACRAPGCRGAAARSMGVAQRPTQRGVSAQKVNEMVQLMKGQVPGKTWDWARSMQQPISIDDFGNVTHGHHRVIAAQIAGIPIPPEVVAPGTNRGGPLLGWDQVYAY
jgi:hypothetical protein